MAILEKNIVKTTKSIFDNQAYLVTLSKTVLIEHFQVWKFLHFTMRNCTPINHNLQYFHWNEVILMRWTLISKTQYNCRKQPLFPWIRVWEEMSLVWWVMWHYYCNFLGVEYTVFNKKVFWSLLSKNCERPKV